MYNKYQGLIDESNVLDYLSRSGASPEIMAIIEAYQEGGVQEISYEEEEIEDLEK